MRAIMLEIIIFDLQTSVVLGVKQQLFIIG